MNQRHVFFKYFFEKLTDSFLERLFYDVKDEPLNKQIIYKNLEEYRGYKIPIDYQEKSDPNDER